jgi:hypothetical protein
MATHLLMKLDKQNMAKTSFKLPASESRGNVLCSRVPCKWTKVLVVTVYVSPNTSDGWKIFDIFYFGWVFSKIVQKV